jgi:hypothetical protein
MSPVIFGRLPPANTAHQPLQLFNKYDVVGAMSDRQAIVNCTSPHTKPNKKPALAYAQMYSPILQHLINNEAKIMKKINELAQAVISTTNNTTTLYVSG